MGSLFGKSTAEPTGMANTCGVKCFSFCTIRKWWGGTLPGASPLVGSSHTTTPEKSLLWRTPGSRESVSTTLPLTLAHQAGMSQRPLKQIRQSQVIVIVQSNATINISGARLRDFRAEQHVGRQAVEEIRAVKPVSAYGVCRQVRGAAVLQPGKNVERKAGSGQNSQLPPSALAVYRDSGARGQDRETLETAHRTHVLAAEKSAAELQLRQGIGEPIEREQIGRDG